MENEYQRLNAHRMKYEEAAKQMEKDFENNDVQPDPKFIRLGTKTFRVDAIEAYEANMSVGDGITYIRVAGENFDVRGDATKALDALFEPATLFTEIANVKQISDSEFFAKEAA